MNQDKYLPIKIGLVFFILLLARNAWLYWAYSYAFSPDSNTYVHLGATFFRTWNTGPIVTFPYPFINALTSSYADPAWLLWFQLVSGTLVGGFFVFAAARKDSAFACLVGALLVLDLVWGAFTRSILTDGVFATLCLLGLGILLLHYDRRNHIPNWELVLAGFIFALAASFRPSHIFLVVLFPFVYLWLTGTWKKALYLAGGLAIFLFLIGLVNLRGTQRFYIIDSSQSYTSDFLAYPLFVYKLYSPQNGPASQKIDVALQSCYPGMDYTTATDRAAGGAFDSTKNMDFILNKVFPCLESKSAAMGVQGSLVRTAYMESFTSAPIRFVQVMLQEMATFLRYGNPYILRFQLNAANNYSCFDMAWCATLNSSRAEWDYHLPLTGLYEKAATKLLQAYLAPVGIFSRLSPGNETLPYLLSWVVLFALTLLITAGRMRFLAIVSAGLVLYTAAVVVAGLGFTERYAAMLSPVQAVYSAIFWISLIRWVRSIAVKYLPSSKTAFQPPPSRDLHTDKPDVL